MHSADPHAKAGALSALTYGSVAGPGLQDPVKIAEMLAQVRPSNSALQVTGAITCDEGRIQQWIEGPEDAVSMLWDRIRLDPRHRVHWASPPAVVTTRHFPGSPMKLAMTTATLARIDPGLIEDIVALPDTLKGSRACVWPGGEDALSPDLGVSAGQTAARHLDPVSREQAGRMANLGAMALADVLTGSDPVSARTQLDSLLRQTSLPGAATLVETMLDHLQAGWMAGLTSTLQRQLAVTMLQSALRLRFDGAELAQTCGTVLVSALPGTPDLCGVMLKVALLRRVGWSVRLVLPGSSAEIRETARDLQPDLIVLSGSHLSARRTELAQVSDLLPVLAATCDAPVILGGKLAQTEPRVLLRLGASAVCGSLSWIATIAAHLAPRQTAPRRPADVQVQDPALASYLAQRRAGTRDA